MRCKRSRSGPGVPTIEFRRIRFWIAREGYAAQEALELQWDSTSCHELRRGSYQPCEKASTRWHDGKGRMEWRGQSATLCTPSNPYQLAISAPAITNSVVPSHQISENLLACHNKLHEIIVENGASWRPARSSFASSVLCSVLGTSHQPDPSSPECGRISICSRDSS